MAQTNLPDYKNLYLQTAKEYVDKLSASLDNLLNNVSDKDTLNNLHIASHSLRSQSQVMGFTNIANICLKIEKISNDALQNIAQLNKETILEIRKEVDTLEEILRFAQDNNGTGQDDIETI